MTDEGPEAPSLSITLIWNLIFLGSSCAQQISLNPSFLSTLPMLRSVEYYGPSGHIFTDPSQSSPVRLCPNGISPVHFFKTIGMEPEIISSQRWLFRHDWTSIAGWAAARPRRSPSPLHFLHWSVPKFQHFVLILCSMESPVFQPSGRTIFKSMRSIPQAHQPYFHQGLSPSLEFTYLHLLLPNLDFFGVILLVYIIPPFRILIYDLVASRAKQSPDKELWLKDLNSCLLRAQNMISSATWVKEKERWCWILRPGGEARWCWIVRPGGQARRCRISRLGGGGWEIIPKIKESRDPKCTAEATKLGLQNFCEKLTPKKPGGSGGIWLWTILGHVATSMGILLVHMELPSTCGQPSVDSLEQAIPLHARPSHVARPTRNPWPQELAPMQKERLLLSVSRQHLAIGMDQPKLHARLWSPQLSSGHVLPARRVRIWLGHNSIWHGHNSIQQGRTIGLFQLCKQGGPSPDYISGPTSGGCPVHHPCPSYMAYLLPRTTYRYPQQEWLQSTAISAGSYTGGQCLSCSCAGIRQAAQALMRLHTYKGTSNNLPTHPPLYFLSRHKISIIEPGGRLAHFSTMVVSMLSLTALVMFPMQGHNICPEPGLCPS